MGVAASVAIGTFIGCLPVYGLHLPLVFLVCLRLRLDGAIAYVAANISNPFVAPFLVAAQVQVGAYVVDGRAPAALTQIGLSDALASVPSHLVVGAPIVGLALGASLGAVSLGATALKRRILGPGARPTYRLPITAPPWVVAVEEVAMRYTPEGDRGPNARTRFNYVRLKMLTDPVARMIADAEGDRDGALGHVTDVGTGRGQLPILLVSLGRATGAHGLDWDTDKIAEGREAAARPTALPVELSCGDARTAEIAPADTVLLVDLIHYFALEEQDAILRRAARAVRPGGRILVREADPSRGWRSLATLLEERVFTRLRWNRGERVRFRPSHEIAAVLEGEGLSTEVRPAWGKTPFSNVLIVGGRPSASVERGSPVQDP